MQVPLTSVAQVPSQLGQASFLPMLIGFLGNSAAIMFDLAERYGYDSTIGVPTPFNLSKRKYVAAIGARQNQIVLGNKQAFRTTGYMFNGPPGSAMSRIRNGLLHSRGNEHANIRAILQPIFARKSIEQPFSQFVRITEEQTNRWRPGTQIDLWNEMCLLTRRLSGRILLNNETDESLDDLSMKIQRVVDMTFKKLNWLLPYDVAGTPFRQMLKAAEEVETTLIQMIQRRRHNPETEENLDVLGRLVNAKLDDGTSLSDAQIVGQMVFFFSASFETTATMLTWTLITLSLHPEIFRELKKEVASVLGEASPTLDNVHDLQLLDRVIKESLRLFPPLPTLARVATDQVQLGDLIVNHGDRVCVSPFATHRDPSVFSAPLQFQPDRWKNVQPSLWQYLPFGAGSRYCVAANYATVLLKVCLSLVIRKFEYSLPKNSRIDCKTRIVLRPKGIVKLNIHRNGHHPGKTNVRGKFNQMIQL